MAEQERPTVLVYRGALLATGALLVLALAYFCYRLRSVALVVVLAGFWAYFLTWPAQGLARWMPYRTAIRIVFFASFLLILGMLGPIGSMLYTQINDLIKLLPEMATRLEAFASGMTIELLPGQELAIDESLTTALEQLKQNAPSLLSKALLASQTFLSGTAEVLAALIVIPLISMYILFDAGRLRRAVVELFPARLHADVERFLTTVNRSLGNYIYSRVLLALFAGLAMLVLLFAMGIPFSLVLSLLAFISEFIPVVGAWVALVPICLVVLATSPDKLLWVLMLFFVVQAVQSYVITPRLMSETMDIHPLTVVIAMLVGGSMGGFAGLLLAIPAAAVLKVLANIFIFRRPEKGMHLPSLDLIATSNSAGGVDYRIEQAEGQPPPPAAAADIKRPGSSIETNLSQAARATPATAAASKRKPRR